MGDGGVTAPEQTRTRILDATLEVIGDHGIGGLTNRRIAARAGVSLGSITYHFASQQEILRAALEMFVDREVDRIAAVAAGTGPVGMDGAAAAAEQLFSSMAAGAGSLGVLELYLHAARDPAVREVAARCWAAYDRLAAAILDGLGVADAPAAASRVVALLAGTQLRRLAGGAPEAGTLAADLAAVVYAPARR